MFRGILKRIVALVSQPGKAWLCLADEERDKERFLSRYVYPLIGMVALAAFIAVFFTRKEFDFELALKSSIKSLIAAFGGFYLAVYLLNDIWERFFKREKDLTQWMFFVGYSSSLMFAMNIVLALLPEFFFLKLFVLYTVYIVWEGAEPYMRVAEAEKMKFVVITTAMILIMPAIIELGLFLLMPGLRI